MKNDDFHKPFIKDLVFVALVTVVSMFFSHYLINSYSNQHEKFSETTSIELYTSEKSQYK